VSHTTTIELEIKSLSALATACRETATPYEELTSVRLFDGTLIEDCFAFTPQGWRFPVAAKNGQLKYDNYEGAWGDVAELNRVKQRYAVNVQKEAARSRGYRVREERLTDGRVKLVVER
jgi:hypothetical protein